MVAHRTKYIYPVFGRQLTTNAGSEINAVSVGDLVGIALAVTPAFWPDTHTESAAFDSINIKYAFLIFNSGYKWQVFPAIFAIRSYLYERYLIVVRHFNPLRYQISEHSILRGLLVTPTDFFPPAQSSATN